MKDTTLIIVITLIIVAGIQLAAFHNGFNGSVFNFTSLVIGSIVGSVLGVSVKLKRSPQKPDIEVKLQP